MTLDMNSMDSLIKFHYAPGEVENIGYADAPGFALVGKKKGKLVGGKKWIQPVGTRLVNAGSSTFSTANAAAANESKSDAFEVPRAKHYRVAKIDNETIEATATGDVDAFEPALDEIEKCMKAEMNWANFRFYRNFGGAMFRMTNSGFATTIMTVDDPAGLHGVSQGDVLKLSADDGRSGALRAGSLTVASVQHPVPGGTGSVTLTGNIVAGVAAAAQNDYVFLDGDFGLAPAGLDDYVPDTDALAATTLFSFDRSVDSRLGGARIEGANQSLHDVITDAVTAHQTHAGMDARGQKTLFMHPFNLGTLSKQLDAKWVVTQSASFTGNKEASIGIDVLRVDFMGTKLDIVPDKMCPVRRSYLVDLRYWTFFHAGMFPAFLTRRNNILKVSENTDGWECRTGGYGNYSTKAPHTSVVIKHQ